MTNAPSHPALNLLARYKAVIQAAWSMRRELAGPRRLADEAAFLPAALSLQDTPVHPAPRRLAYALMALFGIALAWTWFGIVAVAPGRVIVGGRTKLIQPLEVSVVRRVLVKDGDTVQAGQVLVELDPTAANADKSSVNEQLAAAVSEEQRTALLLRALQGAAPSPQPTPASGRGSNASPLPSLPAREELPSLLLTDRKQLLLPLPPGEGGTRAQLAAEWQDISAKLAKFEAEAQRRQAEVATVGQAINKLEVTIPMAKEREADFKKLVEQGFMSSHATQDKTRERTELERDLATQRARLHEAQSAAQETAQAKAAYRAETTRLLSDRNAQAATKRQQLQAEHTKASQRERLTQLTSPVDGVVQQLAIHSPGGVVTAAQVLMVIVPDAAKLSAEVSIANLDIGFVNAGQSAEVKLETFPYTRYGTVAAKVELVSSDAVTDEKRGSFYPATLVLGQKHMLIDGKRVAISPGMNITAEIKTGQRRVIEYLLSPIQRAGSESLRER